MQCADVAIVGGGLAGSISAAMLGRAGYSTVVIDAHARYPADFRCEKLDATQMKLLLSTGVSEKTLETLTYTSELWLVRRGRVVDKIRLDQYGVAYDDFVNAVRTEARTHARYYCDKAVAITGNEQHRTVMMLSGETVRAQIVILASGLHPALSQSLGINRRLVSRCHSVTLGFDIRRLDGQDFAFPALNYVSEKAEDRLAYLNIFRIDSRMRANLFVYRDLHDPWLQNFRKNPAKMLEDAVPNLQSIVGGFEVEGQVRVRPTDLYVTENYLQPRLVLIGDAFATACPASGTGTQKVFTDVERLCGVYIPQWLASGSVGEEQIATFYSDHVKEKVDRFSAHKANELRALSIGNSIGRRIQRWARLTARVGQGALRGLKNPASGQTPTKATLNNPRGLNSTQSIGP